MRVPTRSAGTRSGVNWMRLKVPRIVRASVLTVSVFASPGTPSTSRWPCARIARRARRSERAHPDGGGGVLDRHREADADEHALVGRIEDRRDDADDLA